MSSSLLIISSCFNVFDWRMILLFLDASLCTAPAAAASARGAWPIAGSMLTLTFCSALAALTLEVYALESNNSMLFTEKNAGFECSSI